MKTHISVNHLNVSYGDQRILNNISLNIPDKKITAIIGPSGCGKTTLLKSFNRLLDLQEGVRVDGQVFVDEEDIYAPKAEITHLRKRMGLLSQRPQVLPMSIYENVVYGLKIHGEKSKSNLDAAAEKYLKEANLWAEVKDRLNASATRLSIGQQQRLCLARGLAVEPEIILGDEPTSALDPVSAEQIEQLFLKLKNRYTIVLVTHILRQAKRLADYVVFLYLGNLVEHGPAEKVLNHPRFLKTQSYMQGKFIEEPTIEQTLDLRQMADPKQIFQVEEALRKLKVHQTMQVVTNQENRVEELVDFVEMKGYKIFEIKNISREDRAVIIQKPEEIYTI